MDIEWQTIVKDLKRKGTHTNLYLLYKLLGCYFNKYGELDEYDDETIYDLSVRLLERNPDDVVEDIYTLARYIQFKRIK